MRKAYVSYLVSILALVTTYTRYRNALLLDNGTVEIASFRVPLGFLVGGEGVVLQWIPQVAPRR